MDDFKGRSYETAGGSGSALLIFTVGALVGAAAALILAPATGSETRAYLGRRSREVADEVAARSRKLAEEAATRGRQVAEDVATRGRQVAEDVATRGKQMWNEHGERVTSAVQRGYEHATGAVADKVNGATEPGQAM